MPKSARMAWMLALALSAAPALAATGDAPPPPSNTVATATVQPEGGTPSQRNPLLANNGAVRTSKLVGTNVYNEKDQKLGSVDDVLIGPDGQAQIVLSASDRLVAVPWSKVQFGNAKLNSDNKVIMPDETVQSLKQMPPFKYTGGR